MSKTWNVAEARRQLSRLIDEATAGGGPIYIGRRGKAEVALLAVSDVGGVRKRPLAGLIEIVEDRALNRPDPAVAAVFDASLDRTEEQIRNGARTHRQRTRRSTQS